MKNIIVYITLLLSFFSFLYSSSLDEEITLNLNNLSLKNFTTIVSKTLEKNILINETLEGNVNFISNGKIKKSQLLNIYETSLKSNGYNLIKNNDFLEVKKVSLSKKNKKLYKIIYLKHIQSKNILKILNQIIENKYQNKKESKPLISINEIANSVILVAEQNDIEFFDKFIKELDISKQQVYVKVKILEISQNMTKNIGLKYGLSGFYSTGASLLSFSSSLNNVYSASSVSGGNLAYSGFSQSSIENGISLGASINLLNANNALDIVSEPSLLCINNQESSIYIGETKNIVTGQINELDGTSSSTYKRENIGLKLTVRPLVSDDKVTLNINGVLEDAKNNGTTETTKKEIITTAVVANAQSVILGGYLKSVTQEVQEKVPFFSSIPILGNLFKNSYDSDDKINLVIIITPYIVPISKDLTYINKYLSELKQLEEQYTSKLKQKLEKQKIKTKQLQTVVIKDKDKNIVNKEDYYKKLHNQRVKTLFGIEL